MRSNELFEESKKYLVGGVNSPVRAMKPYPFFTTKGEGSRIYDADGNSYIDYCLAYGPLIFGHAHPDIIGAVKSQIDRGTAYGTPTELELNFAKHIAEAVPSVEMVRFVNTGTEATMGAIRLARGYTGKNKIIKIEGAFHGAHDCVLVKAGSGATTHGMPNSAGIPEETTKNTLLCQFNNIDAVENLVKTHTDIAALILEPIIGNMGCIMPMDGYLESLREITKDNDIALIFDEVITGFRLGLGGAQEYFKVTPDITTLGKIIGGGLPIGVIGAKREIMENMAPLGTVYQAGTFNGNPLSITAGHAALRVLEKGDVYKKAGDAGARMRKGLTDITTDVGINTKTYGLESMYQMYFTETAVKDNETALAADKDFFLRYQKEMLASGIFLPPSQYECNFTSVAHSKEDIDFTLEKAESVLRSLK